MKKQGECRFVARLFIICIYTNKGQAEHLAKKRQRPHAE